MNRTLEDLMTKVVDNYDIAKENDMRFLVILEDNGNLLIIPQVPEAENESLPFIVSLEPYSWVERHKIWLGLAALGLIAFSLLVMVIVLWLHGRRNRDTGEDTDGEEPLPEEEESS